MEKLQIKQRQQVETSFRIVKVADAVKPLGFDNDDQLYRVIREGLFPWPDTIIRYGRQIRINLAAIEEAMKPQSAAAQNAAA